MANPYHNPPGPGGGQFAKGGSVLNPRVPSAVKNSPVVVVSRVVLPAKSGRPAIRLNEWRLRAPVKAATFRDRRDSRRYAVLHPSPKKPGQWQLSRFDEDGATGDVVRPTPDLALRDGLAGGSWKLESAVGNDGTPFGKATR